MQETVNMTLKQQQLRIFEVDDLAKGQILGVGGFSWVYSAHVRPSRQRVRTSKNTGALVAESSETESLNKARTRKMISTSELSCSSLSTAVSGTSNSSPPSSTEFSIENQRKEQYQAMKRLLPKTLKCPNRTKVGFQDMHNEVRLLSQLPCHPNIVRIYGISRDFWDSPENAFLVQEQLVESLDKSIVRWRKEGTSGIKRFCRKNILSATSQLERIEKVAVGIARALVFLHEQRIIFRDIKPANIGLDLDEQPRLFDFGLAKQVERSDSCIKGPAGTLRYMAPEVALSEEYTFSADVYSYAMFLWELCTLQQPYGKTKCQFSLSLKVMQKDKTPSLSKIASPSMKELLNECWSKDPSSRPSFPVILRRLKLETERMQSAKCHKRLNR